MIQSPGRITYIRASPCHHTPVAVIAALFARPVRHDSLFVDPIEAVRVLDGEGTA